MARLVIQADIDTYGAAIVANGQVPMTIGDVIFFLSDRDANDGIFNQTNWSATARLGATIWIEGGASNYNAIDIRGDGTNPTTLTDSSNPTRVHFFGDSGNVSRTNTTYSGRELELLNFNHLIVDFETNSHPGLRDGWGSGRGGTFGLRQSNTLQSNVNMGLVIDNTLGTMKSLEVRGCELTMGDFAKLRLMGNSNILDYVIVERCLFTRTIGGEGIYAGLTTTVSHYPHFNNFTCRDNIFIATAAESIQIQQIGDGSRVYNNVIFIADTDYRSAFQASQDTAKQYSLSQGNVLIYNNVVVGFAQIGLHLFSGSLFATDGVVFGTGVPRVTNNVFSKGKTSTAFRTHLLYTDPVKTVFRDNDVVSVSGGYGDVGTQYSYFYDFDATPNIQIIGGKLPVGATILNSGETNVNVKHYNISLAAQDEPEFVNSGFDGIDISKITRWSEGYKVGKYHGISSTSVNIASLSDGGNQTFTTQSGLSFANGQLVKVTSRANPTTKFFYGTVNTYSGTSININNISNRNGSGAATDWDIDRRIPYTTSDYVLNAENGTSRNFSLYKCILNHDSYNDTYPSNDPTHWELVQWDAAGKNMYDPDYDGVPVTSDFMTVAGDLRLVKGSTHHLLGRGLSCNEQRDDQTQYVWEWKESPSGTVRQIPGAYNFTLNVADYSYLRSGRYVRFGKRELSSGDVFGSWKYSAWSQVA